MTSPLSGPFRLESRRLPCPGSLTPSGRGKMARDHPTEAISGCVCVCGYCKQTGH